MDCLICEERIIFRCSVLCSQYPADKIHCEWCALANLDVCLLCLYDFLALNAPTTE